MKAMESDVEEVEFALARANQDSETAGLNVTYRHVV